MNASSPNRSDGDDMREELRAVLHAGRELPAQMDDTVIDAFVRRLDQHIDDRIRTLAPALTEKGTRHSAAKAGLATGTLAIGIPIVVLSGVFGGLAGVIVALLVVGAIAGYQATH
jgi:hypothetical protein